MFFRCVSISRTYNDIRFKKVIFVVSFEMNKKIQCSWVIDFLSWGLYVYVFGFLFDQKPTPKCDSLYACCVFRNGCVFCCLSIPSTWAKKRRKTEKIASVLGSKFRHLTGTHIFFSHTTFETKPYFRHDSKPPNLGAPKFVRPNFCVLKSGGPKFGRPDFCVLKIWRPKVWAPKHLRL